MPKPPKTLRRLSAVAASLLLFTPALASADVTVRFKNDVKASALAGADQQGATPFKSAIPAVTSLRIKGGKAYTDAGPFGVLVNLTTQEVTLIDAAHKQFATTYLKDYMEELSASMPSGGAMPAAVQQILDSMKTNYSSRKTGRTDMVLGVLVEENEITLSLEMPLPTGPGLGGGLRGGLAGGGAPGPAPLPASPGLGTSAAGAGTPGAAPQPGKPITLMKMVMDIWAPAPSEIERVPALVEWNDSRKSSAAAVLDPLGGMQKLFSGLPGMSKAFSPMLDDLSKNSLLSLKAHIEVYTPIMAQLAPALRAQGKLPPDFDPNAPLVQMDNQAVELSAAAIDDSAFQIPSDYHATPLADLLKSLMPPPNANAPRTPVPPPPPPPPPAAH